MFGLQRWVNDNPRPANATVRRRAGRLAGSATAAGAFLALGMTPLAAAPPANADIDDALLPIADAIGQALVTPALASLDPGDLTQALPLGHAVDSFINSVSVALSGHQLIDDGATGGTAAGAAAGGGAATTLPPDSVPLEVRGGTDPVVGLSVNGGRDIEAVADTGSFALAVPWYYLGLQAFPWPTGFGITGFAGGLDYLYTDIKVPVDFGDGLVTAPTDVHAILLVWPNTLQNIFDPKFYSLESFQSQSDAQAILGLGQTPKHSPVTMALPGDLSQGELINEAGGYLQFGPNPLDPNTSIPVAGVLLSNLQVSIDSGPLQKVVAGIDTGGLRGSIPSSVLETEQTSGPLPPGTTISVYTDGSHPTLLYSYTTTATDSPGVDSSADAIMNTGNTPFALQPIYISNSPAGGGLTIFGNPPR